MPTYPRRALLTSFWLVTSAAAGVMEGVCWQWLAKRYGVVVGLCVAGGLALAGLAWRNLIWIVYRAWNGVAGRLTHHGRWVLLWICYFVVMLAVGKRSGRFAAQSDPSRWIPRGTAAPEAYAMQFDAPVNGAAGGGWVRGYVHWAATSRNLWAIALLPFLLAISVFEEQEKPDLPTTVYTLF